MFFYTKECIAMILAGGKGSRLKSLTKTTAKPAVPFGSKYRLIDFPLSNCANSGIDTVGILTQYQPLQLNEYLGNGSSWGLNSSRGGIHVLSPYSKAEGSFWYKGTANSIFQNISFIERYNPTHILILSGDHIYKTDYSNMLKFHKEKNADCTISVINVSKKEASRFGIMTTDSQKKIVQFEEKPKNPKSTTASMGIYIFKWEILKEYLIKDSQNENSSNDFGKDIIPLMLKTQKKLFAYEFNGFWRDVGTIESLWQTNMDILGENPKLNLYDKSLKIYSGNFAFPPTVLFGNAKIKNSVIGEGCRILGEAENSVISTGVIIEKGAKILNSFIMPNAFIGKNAEVTNAVIGENAVIKTGAKVGIFKPEIEENKRVPVKILYKNETDEVKTYKTKTDKANISKNTNSIKNISQNADQNIIQNINQNINRNLTENINTAENEKIKTTTESGIVLNLQKRKIAVVGKDETVLKNRVVLP